MNETLHENDDAMFDRLADGELTAHERRQFLATLDGRADGWRRCAMAFLEAQSWRTEMRRMLEPCAAMQDMSETSSQYARVGQGAKQSSSSVWLAVAAAVLAAFGLGRWRSEPEAVEKKGADIVAHAPAVEGPAPADDADAVTLVVRDRQGVPQRVQVPLVEGRRLGEQFVDAPRWAAPELRERLAEQGFDLKARRRYAPLFFEQQDRVVPMVVPIDDAVVTPVNRVIY